MIKRFSCQHRTMSFRNDTITARGALARRFEEKGERLVDVEIWTESQHGEKLYPATATVDMAR